MHMHMHRGNHYTTTLGTQPYPRRLPTRTHNPSHQALHGDACAVLLNTPLLRSPTKIRGSEHFDMRDRHGLVSLQLRTRDMTASKLLFQNRPQHATVISTSEPGKLLPSWPEATREACANSHFALWEPLTCPCLLAQLHGPLLMRTPPQDEATPPFNIADHLHHLDARCAHKSSNRRLSAAMDRS
jgi:hypothetical protein